jgi:hypothetical protein
LIQPASRLMVFFNHFNLVAFFSKPDGRRDAAKPGTYDQDFFHF